MDRHDRSPRSSHKVGDQSDYGRQPQLPNFNHFVRASGHPDLAHRGPFRLDTAFTGRPLEHGSLPTPPSASGYRASWLGDAQREEAREKQSAIFNDLEIPSIEPHRRASLVLPSEERPHLRLGRAYSSTNIEDLSNNHMRWHRGRVMHEEVVPGRGACYVYNDGSICPKEINGDAVNPNWGVTKAGKVNKKKQTVLY